VDQLGALLPILLLIGAFYLLLIRPARGRQAAQRATVARMAPGARIMTTAGMFGRVVAVEGDEIDLEIAPGVVVRYLSAAIAKVLEEPGAEGPSPERTADDAQASSGGGDTPEA
jgi:preprotein translocase subunit YajC